MHFEVAAPIILPNYQQFPNMQNRHNAGNTKINDEQESSRFLLTNFHSSRQTVLRDLEDWLQAKTDAEQQILPY